MNLRELQALKRAGQPIITCDEAEPWKLAHCSRASWYRAMGRGEFDFVRSLGRKRLLLLSGYLRWLGADDDPTDPKEP